MKYYDNQKRALTYFLSVFSHLFEFYIQNSLRSLVLLFYIYLIIYLCIYCMNAAVEMLRAREQRKYYYDYDFELFILSITITTKLVSD